ncbi:MAG: glycosyltransferase family 2 protein [Parachlamydiales bacterium]|jgi:glycosyltransferase involved in cell wall biosynthesis
MSQPSIEILLAVYNGGLFLPRQLASIAAQTYPNWTILARDDGSTDDSMAILEEFAIRHPGKMKIIRSNKNLGVIGNFDALIQASSAPYLSFCDQDDIWDFDKLEISLQKMQEMEKGLPKEIPLLVHSDLRLADDHNRLIHPSYWNFTRIFPSKTTTLNRLLAQNVVTGCAMFCNRALVMQASPLPKEALMHDWWIALVAAGIGKIGVIDKQTLSYRQHENNTLGAIKFGTMEHIRASMDRIKELSEKKQLQAKTFKQRYYNLLNPKDQEVLDIYLSLNTMGFIRSRWNILRHGLWKQGLLRQLAALAYVKQP